MNSSLVRTSLVAAGCFASFAFVAACTASTPESDQPEAKTDVGSSESALGGGKKVGSKGCPIAIRCAPGYIGVDTDGDGCLDTCEKVCDIAIRCAPGYIGVDSDGDGCLDTCEPKVCDIAIRCAPGYIGVDSDGDGCLDTCQPEKK